MYVFHDDNGLLYDFGAICDTGYEASHYIKEGDVTAFVGSYMNGLQPFESTEEQTTETMLPSHKTITAAAMTTNRITGLPELLHYW